MNRSLLIATWIVLAVGLSAIAWALLDSADRQVAGGPAIPPLSVTAPPSPTSPDDGGPSSSSTQTPSAPVTTAATTTGDSLDPASGPSTTGSTPAGSSSTSTTISATSPTVSTSSSTPTTSSAAVWKTVTVPCGGGVVIVAHRPTEIRLESATPAAGFEMRISHDGPDEVRVEFEDDDADAECEIRVRYEGEALSIDVDD